MKNIFLILLSVRDNTELIYPWIEWRGPLWRMSGQRGGSKICQYPRIDDGSPPTAKPNLHKTDHGSSQLSSSQLVKVFIIYSRLNSSLWYPWRHEAKENVEHRRQFKKVICYCVQRHFTMIARMGLTTTMSRNICRCQVFQLHSMWKEVLGEVLQISTRSPASVYYTTVRPFPENRFQAGTIEA